MFESCTSLESITIGSQLETLGKQLFTKCYKLTQITINPNNKNFSAEDNVIFNGDKTTLIYYPVALEEKEYVIPSTVTKIGKEAFTESELDSIVFPLHLQTIEESAFYGNRHLRQILFYTYLH